MFPSRASQRADPCHPAFSLDALLRRHKTASLSLEDIVALSIEGVARIGAPVQPATSNVGAIPSVCKDHRRHEKRSAEHHRSARKVTGAATDIGSPSAVAAKTNDHRRDENPTQRTTDTHAYVRQLEVAVADADARHLTLCHVLYDNVARVQVLELHLAEAAARRELEVNSWDIASECSRAALNTICAEAEKAFRRLKHVREDCNYLTEQSNASVTTTAQAYVLNDLRRLLSEQHSASIAAMQRTEASLKTLIETHASSLHMAVARSHDATTDALKPVAAHIAEISPTICGELQKTSSMLVDRAAADHRVHQNLAVSVAEVSARLSKVDERFCSIESETSEQRQLLFEDLSRRAAADQQHWKNHRAATEALLLNVQQSISASEHHAKSTKGPGDLEDILDPLMHVMESVQHTLDENMQKSLVHREAMAEQQGHVLQSLNGLPLNIAEVLKGSLAGNLGGVESTLAEILQLQRHQAELFHRRHDELPDHRSAVAVGVPVAAVSAHLNAWCDIVLDSIALLATTVNEHVLAAASPVLNIGAASEQNRILSLERQVVTLQKHLSDIEAAERAKTTAYAAVAQPFVPDCILPGVVYVAPQKRASLHRQCGLGNAADLAQQKDDDSCVAPPATEDATNQSADAVIAPVSASCEPGPASPKRDEAVPQSSESCSQILSLPAEVDFTLSAVPSKDPEPRGVPVLAAHEPPAEPTRSPPATALLRDDDEDPLDDISLTSLDEDGGDLDEPPEVAPPPPKQGGNRMMNSFDMDDDETTSSEDAESQGQGLSPMENLLPSHHPVPSPSSKRRPPPSSQSPGGDTAPAMRPSTKPNVKKASLPMW